MRDQTPLAPGASPFDVTIYLVLNDFGRLGRAYVETDEAHADEATIVENILGWPVFATASGGCLQYRRRLGA